MEIKHKGLATDLAAKIILFVMVAAVVIFIYLAATKSFFPQSGQNIFVSFWKAIFGV